VSPLPLQVLLNGWICHNPSASKEYQRLQPKTNNKSMTAPHPLDNYRQVKRYNLIRSQAKG
jgi:hypothetical protein